MKYTVVTVIIISAAIFTSGAIASLIINTGKGDAPVPACVVY